MSFLVGVMPHSLKALHQKIGHPVSRYAPRSLYEPWTKFVVRGLKESVIRMVRPPVGYWRE